LNYLKTKLPYKYDMGANTFNGISKSRVAICHNFNHANDQIVFNYFLNTPLHNHAMNLQSMSTK
jgi:hypothetical protein